MAAVRYGFSKPSRRMAAGTADKGPSIRPMGVASPDERVEVKLNASVEVRGEEECKR